MTRMNTLRKFTIKKNKNYINTRQVKKNFLEQSLEKQLTSFQCKSVTFSIVGEKKKKKFSLRSREEYSMLARD